MPSTNNNHDLRTALVGDFHDGDIIADFSPTANEPDLDIWPTNSDLGETEFGGDPEDLFPVYNTMPEPHVRWLTRKQYRHEFGYSPNDVTETLTNKDLEYIAEKTTLTLSKTRMEAFKRLADLWNGECVGPNQVHLLAEKVPSWDEVFGDLDQEQLKRLRPTVSEQQQDLIDAFGHFDWFNPVFNRAWMKSTYIARSRADYDLEERLRTLINGREDLPSLRGDPHEGLTHRFGVGCEAVRAAFKERRRVETYVDIGDYTVDLLEYDSTRGEIVGEVLTHHNNTELYRGTYRKLMDLNRPAVLIFDTRATARRVLNHWHNNSVDVPGGPFDSALNMEWTRGTFADAANDPSHDWLVEDILTITTAWDLAFDDGSPPTPHFLSSLNW